MLRWEQLQGERAMVLNTSAHEPLAGRRLDIQHVHADDALMREERSPAIRHGFVVGGGMTGLAAGMASGFTVLEGRGCPGGMCASYLKDGYAFEIGGGHWIFGGDP